MRKNKGYDRKEETPGKSFRNSENVMGCGAENLFAGNISAAKNNSQEFSLLAVIWWGRTDSNHRSETQQIYSLSPLATRELPQI